MKYAKLIILLAITVSTIVGCGKVKSEPAEVPVETEVESGINEGEDTNVPEDTAEDTAEDTEEEISDNTETNNPYSDYTKTDDSLSNYTVTLTETLNTQMYVIKASDIKKLDQEKAGSITPVEFGVPLEVTGKTANGWYEVVWATTKGYLPAEVLSDTNPNPEPDMNEVITEDGRTTEEVLEDFWELMGEGYDDGTGGISQDALDNAGNAMDMMDPSVWD